MSELFISGADVNKDNTKPEVYAACVQLCLNWTTTCDSISYNANIKSFITVNF